MIWLIDNQHGPPRNPARRAFPTTLLCLIVIFRHIVATTSTPHHQPLHPQPSSKNINYLSTMMLAASSYHMQSFHNPHRASPLSERSPNVAPRAFSFTMSSQSKPEAPSVSRRTHKPNPLMKSRDAQAQRRRDMFFRKVQNDREDRKWEARGEQVCRNSPTHSACTKY